MPGHIKRGSGETRAPVPTLGERLASRDNAVGFIRLVLAVMVIIGHGFPLGGFRATVFGGIHGSAVEAFFAVSGYLILASGERTDARAFVWRRFLRIYPGYAVAVVVTAFVFAPVAALVETGASYDPHSALTYVVGALDLKPSQDGIAHTLVSVPRPGLWNASLWTLFYECLAYAGVLLLVSVPWLRGHLRSVVGTLLVLGSVMLACPALQGWMDSLPGALEAIAHNAVRLWTYFAVGMCMYLWRDRLRPHAWWWCAPLLAWVLLTQLGLAVPVLVQVVVSLTCMPYAVMCACATLPVRIGAENDLSYGLYVYACPVQQLLLVCGVGQNGWLVTVTTCVLATLPVAALSWHFIEGPSLELKRLVPARRGVEPPEQLVATQPG